MKTSNLSCPTVQRPSELEIKKTSMFDHVGRWGRGRDLRLCKISGNYKVSLWMWIFYCLSKSKKWELKILFLNFCVVKVVWRLQSIIFVPLKKRLNARNIPGIAWNLQAVSVHLSELFEFSSQCLKSLEASMTVTTSIGAFRFKKKLIWYRF